MMSINPESKIILNCLATDLDGTLIPLDGNDKNKDDLRELCSAHSSGLLQLIYATGRHCASVEEAIQQHQLPQPEWIICDVGSSIYQRVGNQYGLHKPYVELLETIVDGKDRTQVETGLKSLPGLTPQPVYQQGDYKISYFTSQDELEALHEQILQILAKEKLPYDCIASTDPFEHVGLIDVLPRKVSKSFALQWLCQTLDFSHEQFVFSGDSGNDYDALTCGFKAIVVSNAGEKLINQVKAELKRKQWEERLFIASSTATSGVLEGCKHYGLLP